MNLDSLLSRLDGVKQTGRNRWIARCPSHDDRSPSLSVSSTEDRLLICCFAGCGAADIVHSLGLELRDLFYEKHTKHRTRPRQSVPDWRALLRCAAIECRIVAIGAENMAAGKGLSNDDLAIIRDAHRNIEAFAARWV